MDSKQKVISFSLWGDDKLYCQGAIENVALAKIHYPDWRCRFYVEETCPAIPALMDLDCDLVLVGDDPDAGYFSKAIDRTKPVSEWHNDYGNTGMLWRFTAIDDPTVERVIFRDCDSRIGAREAHAVQEWIDSYYVMHRMHECKEHWNAQVMGGMWGVQTSMFQYGGHGNSTEKSISEYIATYRTVRKEPWIFVDLWWIMDCLWPTMQSYCIGHGYGHPNKFKVDGPMVGGVVNEEWRGQKYVR